MRSVVKEHAPWDIEPTVLTFHVELEGDQASQSTPREAQPEERASLGRDDSYVRALRRAPIPPLPASKRTQPAGSSVSAGATSSVDETDEEWLQKLPAAARMVLQAARLPKAPWPGAPRLLGAVAHPISLPSLHPTRSMT